MGVVLIEYTARRGRLEEELPRIQNAFPRRVVDFVHGAELHYNSKS